MGKKGKRRGYQIPSPEEDERVGKLFVLRPQEKPGYIDGIPYSEIDVLTENGVFTKRFPDSTTFLFLGVGRSTGRRFKGGFFKRSGSQRIHSFLVGEELVEVTIFHYQFERLFKRLTEK